jgi:hypothetical protein
MYILRAVQLHYTDRIVSVRTEFPLHIITTTTGSVAVTSCDTVEVVPWLAVGASLSDG